MFELTHAGRTFVIALDTTEGPWGVWEQAAYDEGRAAMDLFDTPLEAFYVAVATLDDGVRLT